MRRKYDTIMFIVKAIQHKHQDDPQDSRIIF